MVAILDAKNKTKKGKENVKLRRKKRFKVKRSEAKQDESIIDYEVCDDNVDQENDVLDEARSTSNMGKQLGLYAD